MAAALRGRPRQPRPEQGRRPPPHLGSLHPEPKESEQAEDINVEAQLTQRVKPSHAAWSGPSTLTRAMPGRSGAISAALESPGLLSLGGD